MKVTRNTPDQLILADTPWFIGIMLIFFILVFLAIGIGLVLDGVWQGAIFGLVGGGMGFAGFALFVRRVQVILDRRNDRLLVRRMSVFGYEAIEHKLSDLSHAIVQSTISRSEGRTSTLYRPVLILTGMDAGPHPIVEAYSNGGGSHRLAKAVNEWLPANPDAFEADAG